MKYIFHILLVSVFLPGCKKNTDVPVVSEPLGAHFKAGHGVGIPEPMRQSLGIQILDVTEQKMASVLNIPLHVLQGGEANGWITATQKAALQPGQKGHVSLPDGRSVPVTIQRLEKTIDPSLGEFEISVKAATPLKAGSRVTAVFESASVSELVAIPNTAVMKTAEGDFVYVVNEEYFKRVPVETGAKNGHFVEIKDGLYAGDQIVSTQLTPLWMTELQTLRAGQSCCKGH